MRVIYRLKADRLDEHFLEDLQKTYQGKEIEIVVYEVDETEYLLKSTVNRQKLLAAKNRVEEETHLVEINIDNL